MKTKYDKIIVLSLFDNNDRQKFITEQFNYFDLDFEFYYSIPFQNFKVNLPRGHWTNKGETYFNYDINDDEQQINKRSFSIFTTNYAIMKYIYKFGYNNVLLIEDDVHMLKDKDLMYEYLTNIPNDADVVRYGYCVPENFDNDFNKELIYDKLYFKDNSNPFNTYTGAQMYGILNRKTMEIYINEIEETLTGGDNISNIFVHNKYNLNIYYSLTNLALDVNSYNMLVNNNPLWVGYIPFNYKNVRKNINKYFNEEYFNNK